MDLHIDADLADIPRQFERDDTSGEVTAFNDELRVMAIGADEAEASRNFDAAVVALPNWPTTAASGRTSSAAPSGTSE